MNGNDRAEPVQQDLFPASERADFSPAPWVEVAQGRYQPRRIKGSCLGRELG